MLSVGISREGSRDVQRTDQATRHQSNVWYGIGYFL